TKGETKEGVAMVYYGSASGLNSVATILESNQLNAKFGRAVEGLGDVNGDGFSDVIVGAPLFDKGQADEGAAFIYHGSAAGINLAATNILESNQEKAQFGYCSAGAGDVNGDGYNDVLVGAYAYDKGHDNEGAVFVHLGSAVGINNNASVVLEGNQINAQYGWSAATAGDVNGDGYSDIMIGSYLYDYGQTNEGAVFVYHGSVQGIKASAALRLESNQPEAKQGISVACAGDVNGDGYSDVMIGIWQYDKGESNEGAVVLHHGSPNGLISSPASTLESNQADAGLGWSVKSAGDVNGDGYSDIVIGANTYDKGHVDEGASFVWMGMADGVSSVAALKLEGNQNFAQMGWSVSDAGDVNGDGFDDVVIAANGYDNGQSSEGAVFIYHGSKTGLSSIPTTKIESDQIYASMGKVASAGDVNGDGYGDIIIGVSLYGENNSGAALVFHGSAQGIINSIKVKLEEQQGEDGNFGSSVACAGDVNGDGYSDVIVGAPGFDVVQQYADEGMAFVYHGSANGINSNAATKISGSSTGFNMGAVAGLGDTNGDGFGDIAIGNPFYTDGSDFEGAVSVHYGSALGIKISPDLILQANKADCRLGADVSRAGDINGDGYMDIIVGASHYSSGQYTEGAFFIYYGSQGGVNISPTIIDSNVENSFFGSCISTAGDVNGDGYSDILVGALGYSNDQANEGAVFVYLGSISGIDKTYSFKLEGNQESAFLGNSVSGAGDVNGDGYSDIIMGAHQHDNGQTNEGMVYVYHANAGNKNLQNNLRLYNSNLTTPINQTQKAKNDFGAGLYAKSFLGKNKGKLVWETKAKGQGFSKGTNGVIMNSTMSSGSQNAYASLGLTGTELKSVIAKQGPSTKVRVRVKYDPALALTGQLYGPWRYLPAYLVGNSIAPAPEDFVDDMSETVKRKVDESLAGKKGESLYVYPNPASDRLMLKMDGSERIKNVQMLTVEGRSVYRSLTPVSEIDVRNMAAGTYILLVTHLDGSTSTRKVVIEK
ncbi:FG-GAP-like repeat-containing protein, partial [Dyadobacter sp. CY107]|uniref:FG-GAP-like repeat-containing protein n=1 Tax=Dyadobacter fanqingshengii TaxID=2906443 RepID=UPI001F487C57